jgi:hypothetical protein
MIRVKSASLLAVLLALIGCGAQLERQDERVLVPSKRGARAKTAISAYVHIPPRRRADDRGTIAFAGNVTHIKASFSSILGEIRPSCSTTFLAVRGATRISNPLFAWAFDSHGYCSTSAKTVCLEPCSSFNQTARLFNPGEY